jgi:hypothetical protein
MPRKTISSNLVSDIIRLYDKEHLSYIKIAILNHVSTETIHNILKEYNVNIRHICHYVNIDYNTLYQLYIIDKLPTTEIAKRYGVTFPTINSKLRKYNIPIRPKYGNPCNKLRIKLSELPSIIREPKIVNEAMTGLVECPSCGKLRRLYLNRDRINKIINNDGKCNPCTSNSRAKLIEPTIIKKLYEIDKLTPKQIGITFNVSDRLIRERLKNNNIPSRKKGLLKTKVIHNKGTIESPKLGDMVRGYDIGLNDKSYYIRVECPDCKKGKWQHGSHVRRNDSPLCRECSMIRSGLNHSGINSHWWLGGISFEPYTPEFNSNLKKQIRKRDNYTCQLCGIPQNGIKLAIHHIDYNKKNSHPNNLISLCSSYADKNHCHSKTNHNRDYWTLYFNNILKERNLLIE